MKEKLQELIDDSNGDNSFIMISVDDAKRIIESLPEED